MTRARQLNRAVFALMLAAASCHESTGPHLGPLAKVEILSGDVQTAPAGTALTAPLVVIVKDDAGNPLPGQVVNFVVVSGGGSVFAPAAQTNADGKAQNIWTLGTVAGQPQKVEVRAVDPATGAPVVYATFTASVTAGAVTQLVKVAGDAQSGSIAAPLADSLQVKTLDSYGNPVPGATVTWSSPDGGVLSPATSVTRADGTTRARWTTGTHVSAVATATVAGVAPVGFTATAAVTAATNAVITKLTGDGQTVPSGTPAQGMSFSVKLPDGRPIVGVQAGFAMKWTGGGSAWNALTGDNGVIALAAVISAPAGVYTVTAGVNGADGSTMVGPTASYTLTVTPGAPASVAIQGKGFQGSLTASSQDWIPGTALWTSSPLVPPTLFSRDSVDALVKDAFGNPTPGVTVTWTTADGAVARPATSVTGADGLARAHFVAAPVAGAKSRIYASIGLGSAVDSSFVVPVDRTGVTLGITPGPITLVAGTDGDVVVQMNGKDVDSDFLTWTSSDPAVATAATTTPRGSPARAKVSAHAAGTATLTASIGAATGTVTVTVTP